MARFCWRERSERLNWRMLRELQLGDVVRRGDATLLEPYALHLTFARLPVVATSLSPSRHDAVDEPAPPRGDESRNAWFIVRVFQLAMEYLLFLRARDGNVVDSLRQELLVCERECELLMERAKKWKDRSRSGDKQVEKLHQVLQNIAKLLQIEGATSSAVSTIESLLRDLIPSASRRPNNHRPDPSDSIIDEARVCSLCGKMFSSQEFLDKHIVRRHPGVDVTSLSAANKKRARQSRGHTTEARDNQNEDQTSAAQDLKKMLNTVAQTLQDHQTQLRSVAQEEANKIHSLYEQLHIETQLVDETRAKRAALESQVDEQRRELERIEEEKETITEEMRTMKEQLQFLAMRKKIETQNGATFSSTQINATYQLELKRLEETITGLKEALSAVRIDLQRAHESHSVLLIEKHELESQLHEARNHVLRLEASLRQGEQTVPLTKVDHGVQTTVLSAETSIQTEVVMQSEPLSSVTVPPAHKAADEVSVQTDLEDRIERIDSTMQTDPLVSPPAEPASLVRSPTTSIGVGVDVDLLASANEDTDTSFHSKCSDIIDLINKRAERHGHKESPLTRAEEEAKPYCSLPRRRYLRSRFLHDEATVKDQITTHVTKLEHTCSRFGVSAKSSTLANEHVEVVQRALHAHLEVLPTEVLKRMIDIETTVNSLIHQEWMPEEKSRQQALDRLIGTLEAKSQANQGLVRQAMAAFTSRNDRAERTPSPVPLETLDIVEKVRPSSSAMLVGQVRTKPNEELEGSIIQEETTGKDLANESPQPETMETSKSSDRDTGDGHHASLSSSDAPNEPMLSRSTDHPGAPSPESVQEVRRQAIAVRSVKVSVSPKSSPPKPPQMITSPPPGFTELGGPRESSLGENETTEPVSVYSEDVSRTEGETTGVVPTVNLRSLEAVPCQPTLPAMQRGITSFSDKHPESQLGIVIPSRYDPSVVHVHGVRDDAGTDDIHELSSPDSQWGRSLGKSDGASEQSFSAIASSEMSFDASIPSLESDSCNDYPPSVITSSTEQPPLLPTTKQNDEQRVQEQLQPDAEGISEIRGIPSIQEEGSDSDKSSSPRESLPDLGHSPVQTGGVSEVVAFEDDSDIEEVILS